MIDIKPIGSGSSGNCYVIDDGNSQLILEAGVNFKKVQQAMNFDFRRVDGLLITHEHGDHTKYVKNFIDATTVPIYATAGTIEAKQFTGYRFHTITSSVTYKIGSWQVMPFDVKHDAVEPVGFLIMNEMGERLLYVTDCEFVRYKFKNISYMMIEMNYALDIATDNVNDGELNYSLKNRILGSHFEMQSSLDLIRANKSPSLKEVWLIHISKTNGDPERFKKATQQLTGVPVYVATDLIS